MKIAKILNVSVEYLVTGSETQYDENAVQNLNRLKKYEVVLNKLESIPEKSRNSILSLIDNFCEDFC